MLLAPVRRLDQAKKNVSGRVVYVVTSEGRDFYSVMTRVSVASLRLTNANTRVSLACDAASAAAMNRCRDPLLDEVDRWMTFDTPDGSSGYRNRYLKTNLRNLIDGPFLFLDSDTLVREDVNEVFSSDSDLACAPNRSQDGVERQIWDEDLAVVAAMGWRIRGDVYVNGGVTFYNDTREARRFAVDWHRKWIECFRRNGRYRDQPALNAALFDVKPKLRILPHRFNAQLKLEPRVAAGAAILHYFASREDEPTTEFELLVERVRRGAELRTADIEKMIFQSHPWRRQIWLDDLMATQVMRKGRLDPDDYRWFRGQRMNSLARRLARRLNYRKIKAWLAGPRLNA
jgi:hypothetical protein